MDTSNGRLYTEAEALALPEHMRKRLVPVRIARPDGSNSRKIGRNEPCPCGSGKKFKVCCLKPTPAAPTPERVSVVAVKTTVETMHTEPTAT